MALVAACGSAPGADDAVGSSSQALTTSSGALGFESAGAWSVVSGSAVLAASADHVEGAQALSVSSIGGRVAIRSQPMAPPANVDAALSLQITLPTNQPNAYWYGEVQLRIDSPSRNIYSQYVGQVALTGLPLGSYQKLGFTLPTAVVAALRTGTVGDLSFQIDINVPSAGPYLLDNLSFGEVSLAPSNLKAYTGGRDVALLWDALSAQTASYNVYRDGVVIGSAPPMTGRFAGEAGFTDAKVTDGQTYAYQVQAVASDGSLSGMSPAVSITHSSAGFPVPNVTVDSTEVPGIADYLAAGKAVAETWYPKIANAIAYPQYTPFTDFTIKAFADTPTRECAGAGWVGGEANVLYICGSWAVSNTHDMSIFVHESTHIMQNYHLGRAPGTVSEGIASWAGDLSVGNTQPLPPAGSTYLDGYGAASYFFGWISKTYGKPELVRDLNVLTHSGNYTDEWYRTYTGRSLGQLWTEMTGTRTSSPGPLKNADGKCADLTLYDTDDGTPIELLGCYTTGAQEFVYGAYGATGGRLYLTGKCIGTTADAKVVLSECNDSSAQRWTFQNGTVVNAATNGCLQADGAQTSDGTPLVTATCNGSTAQKWGSLPE